MIFGGRGPLGVALDRRDPPNPGKYILNLKLTKYCHWKLSGLVCDLGRLELIVITRQFGFLCRQKDVSKYKFVGIEVTETNA